MAILSAPRTSTCGRAPVLRLTMRFWMSVESLKRPPTLLTIPSSFSSSSISFSASETIPDQRRQLRRRRRQVVVHHHAMILTTPRQFALRVGQANRDGLLVLRPPRPQALLEQPVRRQHENRQVVRVALAHLRRPLHVDV